MGVEHLIKCKSPVCGEERVALQTCALCQIRQPACRAEPTCNVGATV